MAYPNYCKISEIPVTSSGKSPVYYISLGTGSVKIELEVKDPNPNSYDKNLGWRLFVRTDLQASLVSEGVFRLPVQKIKGKVADFYELYFDQRLWREVENSENKQKTHPVLSMLAEFLVNNRRNRKCIVKLEEIKRIIRNKKNSDKYTILHSEILKDFPFPGSNNVNVRGQPIGYCNPEESDLLELFDMSSIPLNITSVSASQRDEINSFLSSMGFDEEETEKGQTTRDLIEIHSNLRAIMEGRAPVHSGAVLYGPPGTGKTHAIEKPLKRIFEEVLDYNWHQVEVGDIFGNQFVGGLSKNISSLIFGPAIQKVLSNRKPCFVYIDEATDLLRKATGEGDSGWRRQGIEAMKSYINKSRYPGLIVFLASNIEGDEMDDALTREGRLKPIRIGFPNEKRCEQLWNYVNNEVLFSKDFRGNRFSNEQIEKLVEISKDKLNVATIIEISTNYRTDYSFSEDDEIPFEAFLERFVAEAINSIRREAQNEINKISSREGMGVFSEEHRRSVGRKIEEIEHSVQERIQKIKLVSDPNTKTGSQKLTNMFNMFKRTKSKLSKHYRTLYDLLNKFKTIAFSGNLILSDGNTITLIKRTLTFITQIEENLDSQKYSSIHNSLVFLARIFSEFVRVSEDHSAVPKITRTDMMNLERIINNLPPELKEDSELNQSESSIVKQELGDSSLILPGDPRYKKFRDK